MVRKEAIEGDGSWPLRRFLETFLAASTIAFLSLTVLFLGNRSWAVTPGGWLDPWIYVNYFTNYPGMGDWDLYYKVSRVPWNALGSAVVSIFGLNGGQIVLAVISIGLMGAGAFVTLVRVSVLAATVGTVLFMVLPAFHGVGGWLYQNTLAGPLVVLLAALAAYAVARPEGLFAAPENKMWQLRQWQTFGAIGALAAAIVIVNTMVVLAVIPLLLLFALGQIRVSGRQYAVSRVCAIAGGALLVVVICAIASRLMGGRYLFFDPLLQQFIAFGDSGDYDTWWEPLTTGWWRSSTYLALPITAVAANVWFIGKYRQTPLSLFDTQSRATTSIRVTALLGYWASSTLLLFVVTYAIEYPLLNINYHAYPLTIASGLALTAIIFVQTASPRRSDLGRGSRPKLPGGQEAVVGAVIAAAVTTGILMIRPELIAKLWPEARSVTPVLASVVALVLGLALAIFLARRVGTYGRLLASVPVVIALLLGSQLFGPGYSPRGAYAAGGCQADALENRAIIETIEKFMASGSYVEIEVRGRSEFPLDGERQTGCVFSLNDVASSLDQVYPFRGAASQFAPELSASNPNPVLRLELAREGSHHRVPRGERPPERIRVSTEEVVELTNGISAYGSVLLPRNSESDLSETGMGR